MGGATAALTYMTCEMGGVTHETKMGFRGRLDRKDCRLFQKIYISDVGGVTAIPPGATKLVRHGNITTMRFIKEFCKDDHPDRA
ncbi:unnamed protein product [Nippostrongylus brasiliensis]|uniref:GMC_oxred_C domain-containing protein n=1 Tax=Nippostrongylus brasiliensis TaxID=27835 RepID=A0A0N4XK36_NIPBR|nr:unnamed protein product [Nippostrongylus brasiliensis]